MIQCLPDQISIQQGGVILSVYDQTCTRNSELLERPVGTMQRPAQVLDLRAGKLSVLHCCLLNEVKDSNSSDRNDAEKEASLECPASICRWPTGVMRKRLCGHEKQLNGGCCGNPALFILSYYRYPVPWVPGRYRGVLDTPRAPRENAHILHSAASAYAWRCSAGAKIACD
jgi:hypothetical protein